MQPFESEALEAIDATLAGEAVDPQYAELAELALLLAESRPAVDPEWAQSLDERVAQELGAERPGRRLWIWAPAIGLAAAAVVAIVVGLSSSGGPRPVVSTSAVGRAAAAPSVAGPSVAADQAAGASALLPPSNGRKIIQAAQLTLSTMPDRMDHVAQEVFKVVGRNDGVVNSSEVTATGGPGGYAQFQLSVPSSALASTMTQLSSLAYAKVASRTDSTQDVNDEYLADTRRLADARALRTSLLKQLANASTQQQINSLQAQLHDAEASISSDEATLRDLNRQINFSKISVSIESGGIIPVGGGGFTIGKAAHDAGRVLTVAAGVALIALAALVPVALLVALGLWIGTAWRHRRREQALDSA